MNVEEYLRQELNAKEKEELDRFLEHVQNHWSDYMAKKQLNVMGRVPGGVDASDSTYRITPCQSVLSNHNTFNP
jgi:hypothetical protein